ncbi:MAG: hypothetical protein KGM91_07710 [Burkholderiales bacterium]|nr:hypothetical protein [Burkholderiales bacterium]
MDAASQARLLAEQAFAAPNAPQIVVKRKRLAFPADAPPQEVKEPLEPQPEPSARAPRVFLAPAAAPPAIAVAAIAAVEPVPAAAEPAAADPTPAAAEPARARRAERIGHDRRAKVIRVVVAPERSADALAVAVQALPLMPLMPHLPDGAPGAAARLFAEVNEQARAHERVTRELSALHAGVLRLRSAAAFIVNEPGIAEEWRRIAATLEGLRQDLEAAQRRTASAPNPA